MVYEYCANLLASPPSLFSRSHLVSARTQQSFRYWTGWSCGTFLFPIPNNSFASALIFRAMITPPCRYPCFRSSRVAKRCSRGPRSEERRVGKSVGLGGRRIIEKNRERKDTTTGQCAC